MTTSTDTKNSLVEGSPTAGMPLTMSSIEIASLTGKRHDHVMVDIRNMLFQLEKPDPSFRGSYRGGNGRDLPCYQLPQRECLILVSGYSIPMRAKIVDRWQELERRVQAPVVPALPQTFAEALRLAADQAAQIEQQAGQIAAQAPKVQAYARIAESDGSMCITDAAKSLQIRPRDLFAFLRSHGWIYTRAGTTEPLAYQNRIVSGFLEHKVAIIPRDDGTERTRTQVRVTAKGLARLAEEFALA